MTERLYYTDSYLTNFTSDVAEADGCKVRLGRSAFYPASGGQPHDLGTIGGIPVAEVVDEDDVVHVLTRPLTSAGAVECTVDWQRRFDHMQQHTGQHLLSAVLIEMLGADTVSFHMGSDVSTVELATASLTPESLQAAELRCNQVIAENRAVAVAFEDAATAEGLRKPPKREGTIRIVSIDGLDRSACGGTHVRSTGEIGCILLRGTERIRGNTRLEFVCGLRAIRRARSDYDALSAVARSFSVGVDDAVKSVISQSARLADAEKSRRKLAQELAAIRGRELHARTPADAAGIRIVVREVPALDDDMRTEAQAFAAGGTAVIIAYCRTPASLIVAASADSGLNAGSLVKNALTARSGRGGGSAAMAQGSLPSAEQLPAVIEEIRKTVEQR